MTVPISLSLSQHSSTYTARQTTMLQASISRSPVSANVRQAPLFLHTTGTSGVQLFTHYITNVATKPRSMTDKANSTLQALMPTFLKSVATKPRSPTFPGSHANLSQLVWQLNQGHRPFRVLMPIFLKSVATKPRSPTFPGSHANLSLSTTVTSRHDARLSSTTHCALRASRINYKTDQPVEMLFFLIFLLWTYAAPCRPAHLFSSSFKCFLVILQALSLSLSLCQNHQAS